MQRILTHINREHDTDWEIYKSKEKGQTAEEVYRHFLVIKILKSKGCAERSPLVNRHESTLQMNKDINKPPLIQTY